MLTTRYCCKGLFFIALAILIRSLFGIGVLTDSRRPFVPTADTYQYDLLARNIVEGKGFSLSENPPYTPDFNRTPVYPLFISIFYLLFGYKPFIVVIAQILITSLLAYVIYSLPFLTRKEAFIASILYAFNLNIALNSSQLLTETLFMTLVFWGVLLFYKFLTSQKLSLLLLSAFILGMGTLTRPIGIFFPFVLGIYLLFYMIAGDKLPPYGDKRKNFKKAILFTLLFIVIFVTSISPWCIRNQILFKSFSVSALPTADNLLFYDTAVGLSAKEGIPVTAAREKLSNEFKETPTSTKSDEIKKSRAISWKYFLQNPLCSFKVHIVSSVNCLTTPLPIRAIILYFSGKTLEEMNLKPRINEEVTALVSRGEIKKAFSLVFQERISKISGGALVVFIFASLYQLVLIIGFISGLKRIKGNPFYMIAFLAVAYFVIFSGATANPRFRVPIEPYLVILSAIGLSQKIKRLKDCRLKD